MRVFTFWKAVTVDREGFLERILSAPDSDLRVQIQTDPRYFPFLPAATPRTVLGIDPGQSVLALQREHTPRGR